MKSPDKITAERLRYFLTYEQSTGILRWQNNRRSDLIGRAAGRLIPNGYRQIKIDEREYYAHRLAWLHVTGRWPLQQIDHRDGVRDNNSWGNLRESDQTHNNANSRTYNPTGMKGIWFRKTTKLWYAQIEKYGERRRFGGFLTPQEAHAAYCAAARILFGDFARIEEDIAC